MGMCQPVAGNGVLASADSAAIVASKPARNGVAAHFMVKLQTPDGEQSFECPDDTYILDKAEEEGLELPYSCRAGSCSSCAGKVISGSIDQSDQAFLDDDQMGSGYCLTCVTYATSDVTIKTHCEDELWARRRCPASSHLVYSAHLRLQLQVCGPIVSWQVLPHRLERAIINLSSQFFARDIMTS